jgi:hypothetical protein
MFFSMILLLLSNFILLGQDTKSLIRTFNAEIPIFNYLRQVVIEDKVNGKKKFILDISGMYMLRMNTGGKVYNLGIINTGN